MIPTCPHPPFSILLAHPASGFLILPVDFPPRDARITGSTSDRNHPWKGIIHGIACNISDIGPRRKKKRQQLLPHVLSLATRLFSLLSKEGVGSSRFLHQASSKSPQQPDPTLPLLFFNTPTEPSFDLKHSMYTYVLNLLLERPIDSMGWACMNCWVNGTGVKCMSRPIYSTSK